MTSAPPDVFLDVLAARIAGYTGRDPDRTRIAVRRAGAGLPGRAADLMLDNLRAHLGPEPAAEQAAAERRDEHLRQRSQLVNGLDIDTATRVTTLLQRRDSLPPRPVDDGERWAAFDAELDDLVGGLDAETGARLRELASSGEPPSPPTAHDEFRSVRRRVEAQLGTVIGSAASDTGHVAGLARARADAELAFAEALELVHPLAVQAREPRALDVDRGARADAVFAAVPGLPAGRLDRATVEGWLADAERRSSAVRDNYRTLDDNRREFAAQVDHDLQRAAGDRNSGALRGRRLGAADASIAFRDGTAVAWAGSVRPAVFRALALPPELSSAAAVAGSQRFEGQAVAAFADALAEHTGRDGAEVLDVLCAAGDGEDAQFVAARRMLVGDAQLDAHPDGHRAGLQMTWAMQDQFGVQLDEREMRAPDKSAPEVGQAVLAAGLRIRDRWQLAPSSAERLTTAVDAARLPEAGPGRTATSAAGSHDPGPARSVPRVQGRDARPDGQTF